jgi:uncharacterized protein (TIGR00255 family)
MLQSMTGYANEELELDGINYEIEMRSLNSKHCDIQIRMPESLNPYEIEIRNLIKKELQRGKINLFIKQIKSKDEKTHRINKDAVSAYLDELKELAESYPTDNFLSIVMNLPGSIVESEANLNEENIDCLMSKLRDTIDKMIVSRKREGEQLETDIINSINNIKALLTIVKGKDKGRIDNIHYRLNEKLEQVKSEIDENRLEQELLYYTEKLDIHEELVRLQAHLEEFESSVKSEGMLGKKLGFIGQEIGREINTIGSKANDSLIQHKVIGMKEELEKIKEQTLNVY